MSGFVRTLWVWLIVLALPVQGAAAASMAFCGPDHHSGGAARVAMTSPVSGHEHHGAVEAAHDVGHPVSATDTVAEDSSPTLKASQAAKQKCSVCASCCSPGALLGTVPVVPVADAASTVFTPLVPSVDAFAADGPERPPRSGRA